MASLMNIAAELRGSIGTSIPQIVDLLKDSEGRVRVACTNTLSKLSEQGMSHILSGMGSLTNIAAELWGSIGTSIPQIVDLLKDSEGRVRVACVNALSKLSEQGT
jgi:HEAT repeat protein